MLTVILPQLYVSENAQQSHNAGLVETSQNKQNVLLFNEDVELWIGEVVAKETELDDNYRT